MNGIYWILGPSKGPAYLAARKPAGLEPAVIEPVGLAVVLCPRGGRYLHSELMHMSRAGIDTLVSLLSDDQVDMLDLADEGDIAHRVGMQFLHHPIPDHELPTDPRAFQKFIEGLAERVRRGLRVGIHCWGSIGRATVTAACTLIHLGWDAEAALAAVEAARGCPVPDTDQQQRWILNYKAKA